MTLCKCYRDSDGNNASIEFDKPFTTTSRHLAISDSNGHTFWNRWYSSENNAKRAMKRIMNHPVYVCGYNDKK